MSCRNGGRVAALAVLVATSACHIILGSEEFVDADGGAPANGGNGAGISDGGNGADGGGGGEVIVCDTGCSLDLECHDGQTDPNLCGPPGQACVDCYAEVDDCIQVLGCESGQCVWEPVADNTPCEGGVCRDGECAPCQGLECQVDVCDGEPTRITGRVFHPGGTIPLPNVRVYIPNADLEELETGPQCIRCDAPLSGSPIAQAVTDATGWFELVNVPSGSIPIVVETGKWRRQIEVDIEACAITEIPDTTLRLPRNRFEGNLPRIAMKVGQADALECMMLELGLDASEFASESEEGAIVLYTGRQVAGVTQSQANGPIQSLPQGSTLFSLDTLMQYDAVFMGCEGQASAPTAYSANIGVYANAGGRVYLSHLEYPLMDQVPEWSPLAEFDQINTLGQGIPADILDTSPKGAVLSAWMEAVAGNGSSFPLFDGRQSILQLSDAVTPFVSVSQFGEHVVQFGFDTPIAAADDEKCGRVLFTDFHAQQGNQSGLNPFPAGCQQVGNLTPQEKEMLFMIFDMTGCVGP